MIMLTLCNIRSPAMRKQTISEDIMAMSSGLLIFIFLFSLTWSFTPVAYINFPGKELPNFYPIFQIMNSFTGIFLFCCVGIGSQRFRAVVMRKVPRSVRHFTIVTFRDVHCDPNCLHFPFQSPPKLVVIGADDEYDILAVSYTHLTLPTTPYV